MTKAQYADMSAWLVDWQKKKSSTHVMALVREFQTWKGQYSGFTHGSKEK